MKTETKANLIFLFTQGLSMITFKTFITERNKLLKSPCEDFQRPDSAYRAKREKYNVRHHPLPNGSGRV
ncbi:MAG TPA: hypothetical protein PKZ18_08855 [Bacteroidales bacterium]|jgi:hypothetical protein|nr:hypothetical protein [Bacteroidales bacterium]HQM93988.1 hypothetical protein [Bacteroidales bacterium]